MYQVSEAYTTKMFDQVQTHKLSGTIDGVAFGGEDVIGVSYTNRCSDKNVALGSVNIGVLKLTFLKDLLNRGDYYGKVITLSDSLLTGYTELEEEIWEIIPIGTFYVGEATWRAEGMVDVTAYDCLSMLDIPLAIEQTSGTIYDFCKLIERHTGARFGMTQNECEDLTNGTAIISPYPDNDMSTYRDLLSKLAQMVGGFAYGDREGTWKLKAFDNTSILSIGNTRRFSGAKYSDFETRFDGLSYQDVMTTGETFYIGDPDGFVMELGNNPFLQYGTPTVVQLRASNIYEIVEGMEYTPYDVSLLPAFCVLDLGDVISFTNDYTGDTSSGCVMQITWTFNKSFNVKCFGSNPNLATGKTKQDHKIAGQTSANKDGRISTFVATNIREINLNNDKQEILKTLFTTSGDQALLTLTEVKFRLADELSEDEVVEVFYYLNGTEVDYVPTETYSEGGLHTLSLMYPIEGLEKDRKYTFVVKMRTSSGAVIEPLSARTYVQGIGYDLTGQFDGYIEASDDVYLVSIGYMLPLWYSELVTWSDFDVSGETASDSISLYDVAHMAPITISDAVSIDLNFLRLATQDEDDLVTQDDEYIILNG